MREHVGVVMGQGQTDLKWTEGRGNGFGSSAGLAGTQSCLLLLGQHSHVTLSLPGWKALQSCHRAPLGMGAGLLCFSFSSQD